MQRLVDTVLNAILTIALLSSAAGCASVKISGDSFQKGVASASAPIADNYRKLNSVQSDANQEEYAADRCVTSCAPLVKENLNVTKFPPKSVQIRLEVIRVLNSYAAGIADLSGSDAPADAASQLESAGAQAKSLSEKISAADSSFKVSQYFEPLSSLAGIILAQSLERKRDKALVAAITAADPQIKKILELIKNDFEDIKDANGTAYDQAMADLVAYYNLNSKRLSYQERSFLLSKIREINSLRAEIASLDPNELVSGIADAQNALHIYATSKRTDEDRRVLNVALKKFGK